MQHKRLFELIDSAFPASAENKMLKWLSLFNLPLSKYQLLSADEPVKTPSLDRLLHLCVALSRIIPTVETPYQTAFASMLQSVSVFHDVRTGTLALNATAKSKNIDLVYEEMVYSFLTPFPNSIEGSPLPILVTDRSDEDALRQFFVLTVFYNDHFDRDFYRYLDLLRSNCRTNNNERGAMALDNVESVTRLTRTTLRLRKGLDIAGSDAKYEFYQHLITQLFSFAALKEAKEFLYSYHRLHTDDFLQFCLQRLDSTDAEASKALSGMIEGYATGVESCRLLIKHQSELDIASRVVLIFSHCAEAAVTVGTLLGTERAKQTEASLRDALDCAKSPIAEHLSQALEFMKGAKPDLAPVNLQGEPDVRKTVAVEGLLYWDLLSIAKDAAKDRVPEEVFSGRVLQRRDDIAKSPLIAEFLLLELQAASDTQPNYAYYLAELCVQVCQIHGEEKHRLSAMAAHSMLAERTGRKPRYVEMISKLEAFWEKEERPDMLAKVLANKGSELVNAGKLEEAKDVLSRAVSALRGSTDDSEMDDFKRLENNRCLVAVLYNLGLCNARLGSLADATGVLKECAFLSKSLDDMTKAVECYLVVSECYVALKDGVNAQEAFEEALKLAERSESLVAKILVHTKMGTILHKMGQREAALESYHRATDATERLRRQTAFDDDKVAVLDQRPHAYFWAIDENLALNRPLDALATWEQFRCRSLLDGLSLAKAVRHHNDTGAIRQSVLDSEAELLQKLRGFSKTTDSTDRPFLRDSFGETILEFDQLLEEVKSVEPAYAAIRQGRSLSASGITDVIREQPVRMVCVHVCGGHEHSVMFVSQLSGDKNGRLATDLTVNAVTSPITIKEIQDSVARFHGAFPHLPSSTSKDWSEFSAKLLGPVAAHLDQCELLYFIPTMSLYQLPFHALRLNGECLIERCPVAVAPSLSVLRYAQVVRKTAGAAQGGIACAPEFPTEEARLTELFCEPAISREELLDIAAVQRRINGKRFLHIGCHGKFNNDDPWRSRLIFRFPGANDEVVWTARDILQLDLSGMTVTVAACSSGTLQADTNDGIIGIVRALFECGASTMIVSLWDTEAVATEELMTGFYSRLFNQEDKSISLAEALAITQRQQISRELHDKTMRGWAPFCLIGDWM